MTILAVRRAASNAPHACRSRLVPREARGVLGEDEALKQGEAIVGRSAEEPDEVAAILVGRC